MVSNFTKRNFIYFFLKVLCFSLMMTFQCRKCSNNKNYHNIAVSAVFIYLPIIWEHKVKHNFKIIHMCSSKTSCKFLRMCNSFSTETVPKCTKEFFYISSPSTISSQSWGEYKNIRYQIMSKFSVMLGMQLQIQNRYFITYWTYVHK